MMCAASRANSSGWPSRAGCGTDFARPSLISEGFLRALSTTLTLAYVATGRVAAYVVFHASALHTAAGSLLAAEAGAVVSDVGGRPWTIASDSIVAAATPELQAELLALR